MASTDACYPELQAHLAVGQQEHVLSCWEQLKEAERDALAKDIKVRDTIGRA